MCHTVFFFLGCSSLTMVTPVALIRLAGVIRLYLSLSEGSVTANHSDVLLTDHLYSTMKRSPGMTPPPPTGHDGSRDGLTRVTMTGIGRQISTRTTRFWSDALDGSLRRRHTYRGKIFWFILPVMSQRITTKHTLSHHHRTPVSPGCSRDRNYF